MISIGSVIKLAAIPPYFIMTSIHIFIAFKAALVEILDSMLSAIVEIQAQCIII